MKRHHLLFVILAWVFAGCGDLILKPQLLIERTLERKNGEWVETRLQSSGELPFIPMPPVVKGLTQEGVFSIGDAYSSSSTGRHHTFNRNSLLITVAGKQQELVLAANEIPEQLKDIPHLNQITIVHTLDGIEQLPIHDVWVHLEPLVWEPAMPENGNELFGKIGILSTNSHAVSFYPHKANLPRYTFGNRSACTMYATPTFEGNIIGDLADYLISQCRDLMTSQFKEKPMSTPHHVYLNQVDSPTTVPLDWLKEIEPIMEGNAPLSASVRIWNITGFATSKEAQDQIRDELRELGWQPQIQSIYGAFSNSIITKEDEFIRLLTPFERNLHWDPPAKKGVSLPVLLVHQTSMSDEWIKQQILPMIEEQADETLLLDLKPLWLNDEELRQVVTEYLIQLNSTNGTTQTYLAEYWQSEGDIKKEWDAWIAVLRDFIFGKHLGHTIAVRGLRKLSESGHGQQDWTLREQFLSFGGIELSPNPGEEILFNTTLDEQSFVFFWLEGDTDGEALVYTVPSYEEFEFSQVQMLHGGIGSSRSDHTVTYPWIQMGQDEWTYTEYGLKRKYTITMRKENETELHMTVKWEPSQF